MKSPNFKGKPSFQKWCNCCRRYGHSIAECRQNQQDNQNKPQKYREPNKHFYQYMKKDQNLPNKNIHSNNSSGKPLPDNYNTSRQQSPHRNNYRGRSPIQRNSLNFSQNRYSRSKSQNNQYQNSYSRSNSTRSNYSNCIKTIVHIQTLELDIIQTTVLEIPHIIETEITQTIGIDKNQIKDHETKKKTIDQIIVIITIDHVKVPIMKILITQIDKEVFLSHYIQIKHNTKNHNKAIEVAHLNIKVKSTKYNHLKKPNHTLPVLTTQKI